MGHRGRTFRATQGGRSKCIAQQIGEPMFIMFELVYEGLLLPHQLDRQRKCAGRIGFVIEIDLIVDGTGFQHLGL